jgi:hypothetical protein
MNHGQIKLLEIVKNHIKANELNEAMEGITALLEGAKLQHHTILTKEEFKNHGGEWLGSARSWIQWNCINGSDVIWGSDDILRRSKQFTVKDLEEIAGNAAYAEYIKSKG